MTIKKKMEIPPREENERYRGENHRVFIPTQLSPAQ